MESRPAPRRTAILALVAAMLLLPVGAPAFFETGGGLMASCEGDVVQYTECVGFLKGVSDSLKTLSARKRLARAVCLPGSATVHDLVTAFSKYARANQHLLDIAASSVVIDAYRQQWPCR